MFALGWAGRMILKCNFPALHLGWYPLLPAAFFLMGLGLMLVLENINKDNPRRLVNIYMVLKLLKIVISMAIILTYYFVIKTNIGLFLIVFGIYYAIYSGIEYYIFYLTEKKIKQNK